MIRALVRCGALLCALILAAPGVASADNYPVRDGTGAPQTFCSKLVTAVQHPCHVIEGLFGGTPTPITADAAGNLNVNLQASATQATPGSDASKAQAVQGCAGCKAVSTSPAYASSGVSPVTAALTSATCTGGFTPIAGRVFNVSGWGTFSAGFQLFRSFDAGTTKLPITAGGTTLYQWTAPASEQAQEAEFGVPYYLCVTSYTSGTLNVRLSQ